jgi:hypothetical protein
MVKGFIADALGRKTIATEDALPLTRAACAQLQSIHPHLTPRLLDYEIWKYQRAKPVQVPGNVMGLS